MVLPKRNVVVGIPPLRPAQASGFHIQAECFSNQHSAGRNKAGAKDLCENYRLSQVDSAPLKPALKWSCRAHYIRYLRVLT
jgi:hypothetical protein